MENKTENVVSKGKARKTKLMTNVSSFFRIAVVDSENRGEGGRGGNILQMTQKKLFV